MAVKGEEGRGATNVGPAVEDVEEEMGSLGKVSSGDVEG